MSRQVINIRAIHSSRFVWHGEGRAVYSRHVMMEIGGGDSPGLAYVCVGRVRVAGGRKIAVQLKRSAVHARLGHELDKPHDEKEGEDARQNRLSGFRPRRKRNRTQQKKT